MKTLAIIAASFLLSGCFYQTVNQTDLYKAVNFCGSVEKITYVSSHFIGGGFVGCRNGKRANLNNMEVQE